MANEPTAWRNKSPGDLSVELTEVHSSAVEPAILAAVKAFGMWSKLTLDQRAAYLKSAQQRLTAAKERLARGIALEMGKPITEALGEMGAVIAKIDFAISDASEYLTEKAVTEAPNPSRIRRRARGPAVVIGPFNFPIHLAHGAITAHLMAGNTVIFKPSPLAAVVAADYVAEMNAVLPEGVFNLVQGGGTEGEKLCSDPRVRSICFTGSYKVGQAINAAVARDIAKDVALELGGKNSLIVCEDADIAKAATAAADAMCLTAGQRCNGTSRVVVQKSVADQFIAAFEKALAPFIPGDPLEATTRLGPVVNRAAVERYTQMLSRAKGEWIAKGGAVSSVGKKSGHYVSPAVILATRAAGENPWPLGDDEAFAPLVEIIIADGVEDAITLANATQYGLSASIFTATRSTFESIASQLNASNIYANLPTTFSPSHLPFGGLGNSGNHHPGGRGFVRFTTDEQVIQTVGL